MKLSRKNRLDSFIAEVDLRMGRKGVDNISVGGNPTSAELEYLRRQRPDLEINKRLLWIEFRKIIRKVEQVTP